MDPSTMSYRDMVLGLKAIGLPISGWKRGTCSYCKNTSFEEGQVVMVHSLPNKLKACMKCYRRPDNANTSESDGRGA
jgi:hypothetical protein